MRKSFISAVALAMLVLPLGANAAFTNILDYDVLTGTPGNTVYSRTKDGRIVPQVTAVYTNRLGELDVIGRDRDLYILRTKYVHAVECAMGFGYGCITTPDY